LEGKATLTTPDNTISGLITPQQNPHILIPSTLTSASVFHIAPPSPTLPMIISTDTSRTARR